MASAKTLRAFSRLLSYPDEQTVEAAELLFIILQGELPEAAGEISQFGAYAEQHGILELEEAFTSTFDVNPTCALEIGWHLFGEEYARGMFLVRMREEMRKYGIAESVELPDHLTHALAVIAAMPDDEAERFVLSCVSPAVAKMNQALQSHGGPYQHVITSLATVLTHVFGDGESLNDGSEAHPDQHAIPAGIDPLHAFPVADVLSPRSGECVPSQETELVQLEADVSAWKEVGL